MQEVWLKPNRRALVLGMILPAALAALGLALCLGAVGGDSVLLRISGGVLLTIGGLTVAALAWQLTLPRVAYHDGCVLFYLRSGTPVRVPLDVVECFFLGQGPSLLPGRKAGHDQTATVVVRLAERASEWSRLAVKPSLGKWCDGYITIRGTWCEPLDLELVNRLNKQLAAANKAWKATQ